MAAPARSEVLWSIEKMGCGWRLRLEADQLQKCGIQLDPTALLAAQWRDGALEVLIPRPSPYVTRLGRNHGNDVAIQAVRVAQSYVSVDQGPTS